MIILDGFGRHKFLIFWLVYVQHKNIIAIGWQQPRKQKHVGCQFAPGAIRPALPYIQRVVIANNDSEN